MSTTQPTRRSLLKNAAAAAIGAPYMITSAALGSAEKAPASERVVLGHIGVGAQGAILLRVNKDRPHAQSVAIADPYRDRRDAAAELIGGQACADFRDLLARPDIDAVIIATPDHWHVPIAMAAARAGKAAYVEKPLGLTIEQNHACRKLFKETGRIFQYGTHQRSSSHCRFGCELVRSGRIGRVHTLEVIAPNGIAGGSTEVIPVPPELDYDMWLGPAPATPYTRDRCVVPGTYFIYDYSIGFLAGWGSHPLDILVWGTDADIAGPITVEGTGKIPAEGLYDTVYDWDVRIEMSDGVKMTFKPGENSTKFIGTEGWVRIWRGGIDAEPRSLLESKIGPDDIHLVESRHHGDNFIDAVRLGRPPVSTLDDAVRSDNLSQLCDIAIRLKRKITWDPRQETIIDDPEAARMISRPMRSPWEL